MSTTVTSVKDGLWSDATVWGGTAPIAGSTVNVRHRVTMDLNDNGPTPVEYGRINVLANTTWSYQTGTARCAGTTVVGSGTAWTSAHVNQFILFGNGFCSRITAVTNGTTMTIAEPHDSNGVFMNYAITTYRGELTHADGETCFACRMLLYVDGGKYEMKPGSTVKFKGTSRTSSTEGARVGIEAQGGNHGTQIIMNGSIPNPETVLTEDVFVGDHILKVANASQFAAGEHIAVYRDNSSEQFNGWSGAYQSDEGFTIHHIEGNHIFVQHRVATTDALAADSAIGQNFIYVNQIKKWHPGVKVYIGDEVRTITEIDDINWKITLDSPLQFSHKRGFNKVYDFNGTNAYAQLPLNATRGLTQFTMAFWVRTTESRTNATNWQRPTLAGVITAGAGSNDFSILTNNGRVALFGGLTSGADSYVESTVAINDNQWHHIAAVNNGTNVRLYIDGVDANCVINSGLPLTHAAALNLMCHNNTGSPASYHAGRMTGFSLWDKALTPTEVSSMMRNVIYGNEQGMQCYLNMDDDLAATFTIPDYSPRGYDATYWNVAVIDDELSEKIIETGSLKTYNDISQSTYGPNTNFIHTMSPYYFNVGDTINIDDQVVTITAMDYPNRRITFTPNIMRPCGINSVIRPAGDKVLSHKTGDKVYKICTVTTGFAAQGSTTITVANSSMLNVGDRICIEGNIRANNRETETTITAKNGNTLTLAEGLVSASLPGFIVVKTNRDCVVTTTDLVDVNRCYIYYLHGSSAIIGRKFIMRYAEVNRLGNSSSSWYAGVSPRGEFNRWDSEREIRGCVVRDGWAVDCGGINLSGLHYSAIRNNVVIKCYNGLRFSDAHASSVFNTISIGNSASGYRLESTYYYNQFQYNFGLHSDYAMIYRSDFNSYFPKMHNIFKHVNRALHVDISCVGTQYASWMKNRFNNVYFRHNHATGIRSLFQDTEITYSFDSVFLHWSSSYSHIDERGMNGGMVVLVNKDFKRGKFEMHHFGGIIEKDTFVHLGNGWSYKYNTNHSTADLRISQMIYVKWNVPIRIVAHIRKNAQQNGVFRPRIVAQGKYLGFLYQEMVNINNQWVQVELAFTPQRGEMIEIGVGGRGTAGAFWVDPRVLVKTHDRDLVTGPYSVNLMFGFEPIYDSSPGVILGGTTL